MRIRLDNVKPGDELRGAYVYRCLDEDCQEVFVGKKGTQFCSERCANRDRQRRFRTRQTKH